MSKFAIIYLTVFLIGLSTSAETQNYEPQYEIPFIAKNNSVRHFK